MRILTYFLLGYLLVLFSIIVEIVKEVAEQYIAEDRETDVKQNQKMAKQVQQAILKMMRDKLGIDQVLDETIRKELILQVGINFFLICIIYRIQYGNAL